MKRVEMQVIQDGVPGCAFQKHTFFVEDTREMMMRIELVLRECERRGGRILSFEVALVRD